MTQPFGYLESIQARRVLAVVTVFMLLQGMFPASSPATAPTKVKLFGYLTARIDNSTVAILDDRIQLSSGGHVEIRDASGDKASSFADLATGQLVQAEGIWLGRHQFSAEKIYVELGFLD